METLNNNSISDTQEEIKQDEEITLSDLAKMMKDMNKKFEDMNKKFEKRFENMSEDISKIQSEVRARYYDMQIPSSANNIDIKRLARSMWITIIRDRESLRVTQARPRWKNVRTINSFDTFK